MRIGEAGAGQLCKVCNQMVIAGTLGVVAEAFALAKRSGIDASKMREALLGGFAASRVLEVHGERILKKNFVPGFKTKLFAKDLKIAAATLADLMAQAQEHVVTELQWAWEHRLAHQIERDTQRNGGERNQKFVRAPGKTARDKAKKGHKS